MASGGTMVKTQKFTPPKNAPKYLVEALKDIGTYEAVVRNGKKTSNPKVVEWIKRTTGSTASSLTTPWCAYWLNAKLEDCGWPSTRSGLARSYLDYGTPIDKNDDSKWRVGDIGVIWRGSKNDGWSGHVFFILSWTKTKVTGLGGNQGDMVSIQSFPRSKLLGVSRPRPITKSQTIASTAGAGAAHTLEQVADAVIPDPTPAVAVAPVPAPPATPETVVLDQLVNTADKALPWVEKLAPVKPYILVVLSVITIGLLVYAGYCRYRDWKEGYNT